MSKYTNKTQKNLKEIKEGFLTYISDSCVEHISYFTNTKERDKLIQKLTKSEKSHLCVYEKDDPDLKDFISFFTRKVTKRDRLESLMESALQKCETGDGIEIVYPPEN